jgi:hypothetical protein
LGRVERTKIKRLNNRQFSRKTWLRLLRETKKINELRMNRMSKARTLNKALMEHQWTARPMSR